MPEQEAGQSEEVEPPRPEDKQEEMAVAEPPTAQVSTEPKNACCGLTYEVATLNGTLINYRFRLLSEVPRG